MHAVKVQSRGTAHRRTRLIRRIKESAMTDPDRPAPPREGAMELAKSLGPAGPARIVYVSCSPATLARDAAVLVHEKGYRLCGAGIANMFPHTSHLESIALFER